MDGPLSPDATCNYVQTGEYNGKDYARRLDGAYFIWWNGIDGWVISAELGNPAPHGWHRFYPDIEGLYVAVPPASGDATVIPGEH